MVYSYEESGPLVHMLRVACAAVQGQRSVHTGGHHTTMGEHDVRCTLSLHSSFEAVSPAQCYSAANASILQTAARSWL